MPINISNKKNRDAVVALETLSPRRSYRYIDSKGRSLTTRRVLKSDVEHDYPRLLKDSRSEEKLVDALISSDPEIDIETFGMTLTETSRVYVTQKGIVHFVQEFEVITTPEGKVKGRRPRRKLPQNINTETPLKWTGKFIKKDEAARKFIFTNKRQLVHSNGLTFDFLFEMARELDRKSSLLLLRAGEKGDEPIVLNRGGKAYNAFLEGRVKGDSYCLILHLSNIELKHPKEEKIARSRVRKE